MSHPGAVRVLCLASRDGAAPPGLLILRVSAFPLIPRERGKGVWKELSLAQFWGGTTLSSICANSARTEGKDFPGMGKAAPGKVLWVLERFEIQRRAPCRLQGHLGLGSSMTAEGHSRHSHQPLLRADFKSQ